MSIPTVCLLAVLCPQGGRLVLPPPERAPEPVEQQAVDQPSVIDSFRRYAIRLRRSARPSEQSRELVLKEISGEFDQPSKLALRLARTADADELFGLLQVVRRFGDETDGKELHYLLLTRPFRGATRLGLQVMVELSDDPKIDLHDCFTARYPNVRKAATDLLLSRVDKRDLPWLLDVSRDEEKDVRRKVLLLLGALPYPESRQRLLEALSEPEPTIAATACMSLVEHGPEVAPALQEIVSRAARERSFGYAAFALTVLEDQTGQTFLTEEMVPHLREEMTGMDAFMKTTCALALANLAFRSDDRRGERYGDREIVDGLLQVVSPSAFVSNLSMLQRPAARKLALFTGIDFPGRNAAWRGWWEGARPTFTGTRLALDVTPETAVRSVLTWADETQVLRFRGEEAELPTEDPSIGDVPVDDFLLSGTEMASLVERLRSRGFMTRGLLASAADTEMLPVARTLDLELGAARCRVRGPTAPAPWLDVLGAEVAAVAERERWQLYPEPGAGDALAFWRAERQWLADNPARADRGRRLIVRIIDAYPGLAGVARTRALDHLESVPELRSLLTEENGMALAAAASSADSIDGVSFRLLQIAVLVPGDRVWRRALDVIDAKYDKGGMEVLPRLLSLVGPENIRAAIRDGRSRVRGAAILEVAKLRDLESVPELLSLLNEPDRAVRDAAIYALGMLEADQAREPLIALQADVDVPRGTRRVAWVALGRIGGEGVFPILQSGAASIELADRLSAIQALGELEDPAAAQSLAQIFVAHGQNPVGTQAMVSLQNLGGLLARPALRRHLTTPEAAIRRDIVLLLAEFADPTIVPDLIAFMEEEPHQQRWTLLLSGITGVDLLEVNDRVRTLRDWWATHRNRSQAAWFLESLARHRIETSLGIEQLTSGSGLDAVDELSRIMVSADKPHVRVLAGALLRDVTNRDFGTVSMQTPPSQLQAVADRYRFFADAERAVRGR